MANKVSYGEASMKFMESYPGIKSTQETLKQEVLSVAKEVTFVDGDEAEIRHQQAPVNQVDLVEIKKTDLERESKEEVRAKVIEDIMTLVSRGYVAEAVSNFSKAIEAGIATKEDFLSEEIGSFIVDRARRSFSFGDVDHTLFGLAKAIEVGFVTKEDFSPEELRSTAIESVKSELSKNKIDHVLGVISQSVQIGFATKEDFQSALTESMKGWISKGRVDIALSIFSSAIEAGASTKENLLSEKFESVVLEHVKRDLSNGLIDNAILAISRIIKAGLATKEDFHNALVESVKNQFFSGKVDKALSGLAKAINAGLVTKEDFSPEELRSVTIEAVNVGLSSGSISYALPIISRATEVGILMKEDFQTEEIKAAANQGVMSYISSTALASFFGVLAQTVEAGLAAKEDFQTEEIKATVVQKVQHMFSVGHIDYARKALSQAFEAGILMNEDFEAIVKESLKSHIANDSFDGVILFVSYSRELGLSPTEFRSYATAKLKEALEERSLFTLSTLVSNAPALGLQDLDFLQNKEQPILAKASYLALRDFGAHVTREGIELYESMLTSKQADGIPEEARILGIEHPGSDGLESLRARFREEVFAFIRKEEIHEGIADMPVFTSFLKKQIRFEGSQFGQHGDDEFLKTLDIVRHNQEAGLTRTHFAYQNAFLDIPTASTETAKVVQEPEAIDGVKTVATAIEGAQFLAAQLRDPATRPAALERMQSTLDASLGNAVTNLSSFVNKERERISASTEMDDRQKQGRLKGLETKQRLIDVFVSFQAESLNGSIERIFGDQTNQETSVEALRALLKPETLAKGEEALDPYRGAVRMLFSTVSVLRLPDVEIPKADQEEGITRDQANTLLNLTDHVLIQETLALGKGQEKPLTKEEKELRHAGERILRTPQIKKASEAFERAIQAGTETQSIEIIPSRGTLLEFSGHISDACWASKYNIAKDFPNITSLTFVLKEKDGQDNPIPPDPINDKIVGSCLLIEAEDAQDNPVLIMRGMNPLENTINRLMPKAFVDQLMSYVEGVAKKMGRKVAIVVDEASQASTNRPSIAGVLKPLRDGGKLSRIEVPNNIQGKAVHPTNFNGYDISQKTYQWKKW